MDNKLKSLYESTAEDMLFGIGVVVLPGSKPAPIDQLHYRKWTW